MGTAHVTVAESLRQRLRNEARLADVISITGETYLGGGLWLLDVATPLLPKGFNGEQEIIVEDHAGPRFKKAADDDIGAGRPFRTEDD